jgi:hypothetical protein
MAEEAAYLMVARKQEREIERKRQGKDTSSKVMLPVTYFFQLGPTSDSFHHLSIMLSNYKSISVLIHRLGQSPHDPIISQ